MILWGWFAIADKVQTTDHPVPESPLWLTYQGEQGRGKGQHIVLIAADQEYRSEHALPMLAKILATHHGLHCTVRFSLNANHDVDPTQKIRWEDKAITHHIPGLEHLEKCDLVIFCSRLISLPPEQLQHIYKYLDAESCIEIVGQYNPPEGGFEYDTLHIRPQGSLFGGDYFPWFTKLQQMVTGPSPLELGQYRLPKLSRSAVHHGRQWATQHNDHPPRLPRATIAS